MMNVKELHIIFPHQLFKNTSVLEEIDNVLLIEEYLFFNQYKFHKQKIAFHRASMKAFAKYLTSKGKSVDYLDAADKKSDIRKLLPYLKDKNVEIIHIIDPTDNYLEKRIKNYSEGIDIKWYDNPLFINTKAELSSFFKPTKKKFFQTSFYKNERKNRNILMTGDSPQGGKLTFDSENRKKYPKGKTPPSIQFPNKTNYHKEAEKYVEINFSGNYGDLNDFIVYPIDFKSAETWLQQFFEFRFHEFGAYEDAIVKEEHFLNHSLLSPLINVGLLNPMEVIEKAIDYAIKNDVPIHYPYPIFHSVSSPNRMISYHVYSVVFVSLSCHALV